MRVLEVYQNCGRGHAVGHLLLKPKPQPQREGLHTTRDAGPRLLGLGSVAAGNVTVRARALAQVSTFCFAIFCRAVPSEKKEKVADFNGAQQLAAARAQP